MFFFLRQGIDSKLVDRLVLNLKYFAIAINVFCVYLAGYTANVTMTSRIISSN